jgi:hypothetical protein
VLSIIAGMNNTAGAVAESLLSGVGTRLAHSACVARQAARVQHLLPPPWRSALVAAAWMHDVGYNEILAEAGFHPLDGARWLRDQGWSFEICCLVAWHTRAGIEAQLRGLRGRLEAAFPPPPDVVQAALAWADLTSSPTGECCTMDDRLADIMRRYPAGSSVREATAGNREVLRAWVLGVEATLSRTGGLKA